MAFMVTCHVICIYVTEDVDMKDSSPALARRLTFNQLVFHKVLGKGSFGKVGHVYHK